MSAHCKVVCVQQQFTTACGVTVQRGRQAETVSETCTASRVTVNTILDLVYKQPIVWQQLQLNF